MAEQLRRHVAQRIEQKSIGTAGSNNTFWVNELTKPRMDPYQVIMRAVRQACEFTSGVGERSYRRPSRFNSRRDMAIPTNVQPVPRITVIVDTSGSMGKGELAVSLGLIRKVLDRFRIRNGIRVVTGDTSGKTKTICMADPRKIEMRGGGGTNMGRIIEEVAKDKPQPQLIVVCTDGQTPWPKQKTDVPVVACLTSKGSVKPPPWMKTVYLNS